MSKVPALSINQNDTDCYIFKLPASKLFEITRINERIEGKEEGYQRVLSPGRVKSVARYIQGGGLIPGPIIISFTKLNFSADRKEVTLPEGDEFGWVIDGQHRLAGAYEASKEGKDIDLAVVGYEGLSVERQIELFITINREAKNVPSSLYLDLLKNLPRRKSEKEQLEERITDIARTLNNDETSPFFQRIIFTKTARAGEISLTNFARVLRPIFNTNGGVLGPYTLHEQSGVIKNYYQALFNSFPKHAKETSSIFFKTVGFGGVWKAFPFVFTQALTNYNASNVASFTKIFNEIAGFDFDKWNQYGTGSAAELQAGEDLLAVLKEAVQSVTPGGLRLKLD